MSTAWNVDAKTGRFLPTDPMDVLHNGLAFSAGCWEWQGELNSTGYGRVAISRAGTRQRFLAHKLAFEDAYGPIPDGMVVRHKCDNRKCARWSHLTFGTYRQNAMDAVRRGGIKSGYRLAHCKHGHAFTEENTYRWTSPAGGREMRGCKECMRRRNRHAARARARKNGVPFTGNQRAD